MILVDAGPLVALVDADDQHHERCVEALKRLREPMGTVWPALTEAMYLLGDLPKAQEALWEMLTREAVQLLVLDLTDVPRIRALLRKYADLRLTGRRRTRQSCRARGYPEDIHG